MFTTAHAAAADYRRDLGDGLVLRWSTAEDSDNIARMIGRVFRDKEQDPPNLFLMNMVYSLMESVIPVMGAGDYAVVEDTSKEDRPIVAGVCLQRQQWEYEGIPFTLGRPEVVASEPAYRNKGLIRALFELVHARSEAEGHLAQGITGIPYFYRQFGYEYALDLGGGRAINRHVLPALKEGESEAYTLREATIDDLAIVRELYDQQQARYMLFTHIPDDYWRYLLDGWRADPERRKIYALQLILDTRQTVLGMLLTGAKRWGKGVDVQMLASASGVNLQAIMPSVLRALQTYGEQNVVDKPDMEPLSTLRLNLGRSHPVYDALGQELAATNEPPYAWYIRVADLPRFIQHIAAVLEKRLAQSPVAGYTGEFKLNFYRGGLRLAFEHGRLIAAENWHAPIYSNNSDGGFPPKVFLQALFGYRSLKDLRSAYPDVRVNNEALFNSLFPEKLSWTLSLP